MIRRLKKDILSTLPLKKRHFIEINVRDKAMKLELR